LPRFRYRRKGFCALHGLRSGNEVFGRVPKFTGVHAGETGPSRVAVDHAGRSEVARLQAGCLRSNAAAHGKWTLLWRGRRDSVGPGWLVSAVPASSPSPPAVAAVDRRQSASVRIRQETADGGAIRQSLSGRAQLRNQGGAGNQPAKVRGQMEPGGLHRRDPLSRGQRPPGWAGSAKGAPGIPGELSDIGQSRRSAVSAEAVQGKDSFAIFPFAALLGVH